jgi:hypothetical protein
MRFSYLVFTKLTKTSISHLGPEQHVASKGDLDNREKARALEAEMKKAKMAGDGMKYLGYTLQAAASNG